MWVTGKQLCPSSTVLLCPARYFINIFPRLQHLGWLPFLCDCGACVLRDIVSLA